MALVSARLLGDISGFYSVQILPFLPRTRPTANRSPGAAVTRDGTPHMIDALEVENDRIRTV
jgi:hypothetical protein